MEGKEEKSLSKSLHLPKNGDNSPELSSSRDIENTAVDALKEGEELNTAQNGEKTWKDSSSFFPELKEGESNSESHPLKKPRPKQKYLYSQATQEDLMELRRKSRNKFRTSERYERKPLEEVKEGGKFSETKPTSPQVNRPSEEVNKEKSTSSDSARTPVAQPEKKLPPLPKAPPKNRPPLPRASEYPSSSLRDPTRIAALSTFAPSRSSDSDFPQIAFEPLGPSQQAIAYQRELERTRAQLTAALDEIVILTKQVKKLNKKLKASENISDKGERIAKHKIANTGVQSLRGKGGRNVIKHDNGFGNDEKFILNSSFWEKKKKKITVLTSNISLNEKLVQDVGGRFVLLFICFFFSSHVFFFEKLCQVIFGKCRRMDLCYERVGHQICCRFEH